MREWLVELLVDPQSGAPLRLEDDVTMDAGEISHGSLVSVSGHRYEIRGGIPRFVGASEDAQVAQSFNFKWSRQTSYDSERFQRWYTDWLLAKYGFADLADAGRYFGTRRRILEVGCGAGLSASVSRAGVGHGCQWVGLDLSSAVDIAQARLGPHADCGFVQADLMQPPFRPGVFDTVFSEGVLHHTPSTRRALASLVTLLTVGGEVLFYIYAKKGPIREFADDHIRSLVSRMPADEAWAALLPVTKLAKALSDLKATVTVPEDVPQLGIKAGTYDVQRLIYWHFAKLFWNDELGFDGSHHVNFDWYHPAFAHRHTEEEIRGWCDDLGLKIVRLHAQESGYTIRAVRE